MSARDREWAENKDEATSEVVSKTKNLDVLTDVYRLLEKVKVKKMTTKNTNFNL